MSDKTESTKPEETGKGSIESLKRQVLEMTQTNADLQKDIAHHKSEVDRISNIRDNILEEKRAEQQKVKDLQALFGELTEEQIKSAVSRFKQGDEAVEQQVSDILKSRIRDFKEDTIKPLQDEAVSLREKNKVLRDKLSSTIVTKEIYENAKKNGAKPDMLKYFVFEFNDRIGVDSNGDPIYKNREGHQVESINWEHEMIKLKDERPGLFEANRGSRARSQTAPNIEGEEVEINPWAEGQINISKQVLLRADNPELADKLEKAAKKR